MAAPEGDAGKVTKLLADLFSVAAQSKIVHFFIKLRNFPH